MRGVVLCISWLLCLGVAQAKTVVLIHGFASGPGTWYKQGIVQQLVAAGFAEGGVLPDQPRSGAIEAKNAVYVVRMPWWKPLQQQAVWLDSLLKRVYTQRRQPVILVGHSSGGVVARFYTLWPELRRVPIAALITIAAPNLGTPFANWAWRALTSPFGRMLDVMDNRSRRLYAARELLWQLQIDVLNPIRWMAFAPHPYAIQYMSITHARKWSLVGTGWGIVVPPKYQDLRRVPALGVRARNVVIPVGHGLHRWDGAILQSLLLANLKTGS